MDKTINWNEIFTDTHVHYEWSNIRLSDSTNRVEPALKHMASLGRKGLCITDHEVLSGHVKFLKKVDEMKQNGDLSEDFKPILGNEIYLLDENEMNTKLEQKEYIKFHHFILLAKDKVGHEQLRKLSTLAWRRGFSHKGMDRVPTFYSDFENVIGEDKGHLIATTACLGSLLGEHVLLLSDTEEVPSEANIQASKVAIHEYITWAIETFGKNDFYIELQPTRSNNSEEHSEEQKRFNEYVVRIIKGYELKHTIATDVHYLTESHRKTHSAFLTSGDKEGHNREVDKFYATTHFFDANNFIEIFDYLDSEFIKKAMYNTQEIREKIEIYSLFHKQIIPKIIIPNEDEWEWNQDIVKYADKPKWLWIQNLLYSNEIVDRRFVYQVLTGLEKWIPKEEYDKTLDRVNLECMEITGASLALDDHFTSYFLTMQKNIDIIWEQGDAIVMPGRGSSVGYVIDYLMEITQINPLTQHTELPHWRFISADRPDAPDIDIDFSSHRKQRVFDALNSYYKDMGGELVRVGTFGTETAPSAIKTSCRGLGIDADIASMISSLVPVERGNVWSIEDCYYGSEEDERESITEMVNLIDQFDGLLETILEIQGIVNKRSSHPCGVIIANTAITDYNALMRTPSGDLVTQYDLGDTEYLGGMKYDFLNTKTASMVHVTLELMIEHNKIEWQGNLRKTYAKYLYPEVLEMESLEMWNILNKGKLLSAFQFDSTAGRQAINAIQMTSIQEAIQGNNLMRLMATESGVIPMDMYVTYKNDINTWYTDMKNFGLSIKEQDLMKKHLSSDYGVSATQESMMMLSMDKDIGGFNVVESNVLRKGVAKKIGKKYEEAHNLFYEKGLQRARKILLDYVWNIQIAMQRGYSFSLLHTTAYSYILIQQLNLVYLFNPIYWNSAVLLVNSKSLEEEGDTPKKNKSTDYGAVAMSIEAIKSNGTTVSLPHINDAKFKFNPDEANNEIVFGLKGIVGINDQDARAIVNNRPFASLLDFHKRMTEVKHEVTLSTGKKQMKSIISKSKVFTLIKSGAFDKLENKPRRDIMEDYLDIQYPYRDNFTMSGVSMVSELDIIPTDKQDLEKMYNFKTYVSNKQFFHKEYLNDNNKVVKNRSWQVLKGETEESTDYIINYFLSNFSLDLKEERIIIILKMESL